MELLQKPATRIAVMTNTAAFGNSCGLMTAIVYGVLMW